ncbi:MAG TPA: amino acid adenylation domain-containing protein [Bacillota bacterium]|nr:amino acid adenylation domain-containing protein [Bacillota bacterium]
MSDLAKRIANLSPEKLQKLETQLKAKGIDYTHHLNNPVPNIYSTIEPGAVMDYYPLSSAQKRMFVLSRMDEKSTNYNVPQTILIEGNLRREKLEKAFQLLVARHEIFRTSFEMVNGQLVQRVHHQVDFEVDYQELTEDKVAEAVYRFIQPFELSKAPLLRVGLFRFQEQRHLLLYDMHHIVTDGVSLGILIREFIDLYEERQLPNLRIQYKDYATWQNELFKNGILGEQEKFWRNCFAGEIPVLNLPLDYPRPAIQSFVGNLFEFTIEPGLTGQIKQLAAGTGATLYMVLLAAFNVLLSKYSGQEDIIVGSPVAGRPNADLENIIGIFINTLALRNYPAGPKTFREFLEEVKKNSIQAFRNQDYSFENLVETLGLQRDLSRNPLFDVMFVLQNMSFNSRETAGLKFSYYPLENKTAKFDLTLQATESENGINLVIEYATTLFKRETMARLAAHFQNILQTIVINRESSLDTIEMLSIAERRQILIEFNDTHAEYPSDKIVYRMFEDQVEKSPEHKAVVFADQSLTYRELNGKANQLAWRLREKGVKPGCIVGIIVNRSLEMLIGILGILKAGAAYLPIDPTYPEDRIRYMLEDSGTSILLARKESAAALEYRGQVIDLFNGFKWEEPASNLEIINTSQDLAYVIYTSGSTGRPKGVMVSHHALHNFIFGLKKQIDFRSGRTILGVTTVSFDIFALETFIPLTTGMKVVLCSEKEQLDMNALSRLIIEQQVEMLQLTPSRLQILLRGGDPACFSNIREIMVGGEAMPELLLAELKKIYSGNIYNMYGPTETTVWSTTRELTGAQTVDIGKPIANTQIYIVNPLGAPQPIGVPGELCIGGDGLARGYLNRPELTAEKFVGRAFGVSPPDEGLPPEEGQPQRIYRTGDLVRWLPDGNIQFLGRIDHQIKIRGFRIELGEIEAQLSKHEAVKEAIVITNEDPIGGLYLCAYLSINSQPGEQELLVHDLRRYLAKTLPEYMIPSYFIQLEKLPLTSNGKIDRRRLPKPEGRMNTKTGYVAPENELEQRLATVWAELLKCEQVGIHDNFFEIGGNSIMVVRLHMLLEPHYPNRLKVVDFFTYPTIFKLAQYLQSQLELENEPPAPQRKTKEKGDLTRELNEMFDALEQGKINTGQFIDQLTGGEKR